ncbi:MAG: metal-dependent hydrolase [Acidimicrobiia bacterium]
MLLWQLGATLWLFRWIFRDPKVDVRFLLLGAILPDLVDLPLGTMFFASRYSTGELWFHSLLAPTMYMVVVLVFTRRGRRRRAWMAVGIGWLFHLLLDGMWVNQNVFLWPFFGWEIPPGPMPFWSMAWERALADPWRWVMEVVGLAYLIWLWFALGLNIGPRRQDVVRTGRLPEYVAQDL